jgi:low temperature requirement protein LtrA
MTEPQRRADWFELFFDLVFVVTVSILAHGLHGDPGWAAYGTFLVLFFPAWWAWVNLLVSVNLFGARWTRALLLLAMPGLGVMAAAAPAGLGSRAWAFALGAAWVRLVTFAIWWTRTRATLSGVPRWRPVAYGVLTAGIWAVSALVPAPGRYALWILGIGIEIALLTWRVGQPDELYGRLSAEHLIERVGLFLVIVLGESVFGVVTALADHFTWPSAAAALGGFVTAAMLAISFFRWGSVTAEQGFAAAQARVAQSPGVQSRSAQEIMREVVLYLPFLLVSSATVLAAAATEAVFEPGHTLPTGHQYALAVGIAGYYLTNAAIARRLGGDTHDILRWVVPSVLLPLVIVLPLAAVAPAWLAVIAGALVTMAMVGLGKLNDRRRSRASAIVGGVPGLDAGR